MADWLKALLKIDLEEELSLPLASAFCGGAQVKPLENEQQGCDQARIVMSEDGAITYQQPAFDRPRPAGSFCILPPAASPAGAPPQESLRILVSARRSGSEDGSRSGLCGYAKPGYTYPGIGVEAGAVVALRTAALRSWTQFQAELAQRVKYHEEAVKKHHQIWPLVESVLSTPLAKIAPLQLHFVGQVPAWAGSRAQPLYTLDALDQRKEREQGLFDTQKPQFFVFNLQNKDRVCLQKGAALNDSAVPLAIIDIMKKAAAVVTGRSPFGMKVSAIFGDAIVQAEKPLDWPLYRQDGTSCKLQSVCAKELDASCAQLKQPVLAGSYARLCQLLSSPDSEGGLSWQSLGGMPLRVSLLFAELGNLKTKAVPPDSASKPSVVAEQVAESLDSFAARLKSAKREAIAEEVKGQQPGAPRTAAVLSAPQSIESGFLYELKVLHAAESATGCVVEGQAAAAATGGSELALALAGDHDKRDKVAPSSRASRSFAIRAHRPYFSTATEMSVDIPMWPSNTPLGGYHFDRVASGAGSEQVYQLLPQNSPQQHVSFAQLFVLYPFARVETRWAEGLGLAVGPTFIHASGSDAFSQLNFRILWEPPITRGVLLSIGPSLRWVDVPLHYPQGTLLVQPAANAPTFAAASRMLVLFSIGVALDEVVVGKAVAVEIATLKKSGKSTDSDSKKN